jgi:hypothetical protein
MKECGTGCAYCGRELAEPYEAWLDLSVDHVVPTETIKRLDYPSEWVENLINLVTCCRTCNEFLNGYRIQRSAPTTLEEFVRLRDEVFFEKRRCALERHQKERADYLTWRESDGR